MGNRIQEANAALWTLVEATFGADQPIRNPADRVQPKANTPGALVAFVSQDDDEAAEVFGTMATGPIYDLKVCPLLTFAFNGKTKTDRAAAAWAQVEILKAALAANRRLGGAVSWADIEDGEPIEAAANHWLAGGLEVRVRLLFSAPTPIG